MILDAARDRDYISREIGSRAVTRIGKEDITMR